MNRHRPGFTLVELMVSVAIIGILVSASALYASQARSTARDGKRINDLLGLAQTIDQYRLATRGSYPKNGLAGGSQSSMCSQEISFAFPGISLSAFPNGNAPTDPLPAAPYSSPCTSAKQGYRYHTLYGGSPQSAAFAQTTKAAYTLEVLLERPKDSDVANLSTPSSTGAGASLFPDTSDGRTRYFLNGPGCGTGSCYQ